MSISIIKEKKMTKRILKIDREEYWILSSAALVIRGIFPDAGDIDIAVTEKGFEELNRNYTLEKKTHGRYAITDKIECVIEEKEEWKIEKIGEYYIQSLERYYEFLKSSNREKDNQRMVLIEKHLSKKID